MRIPVFIRDGWYDHHLGSAIATYGYLSEESRAHTTLQLGPWNHGYGCALTGQPYDNLKDDSVESPMKWFETILLKKEMPAPQVLTYVCGKDQWESWDRFPVPVQGEKTWYLDSGKSGHFLRRGVAVHQQGKCRLPPPAALQLSE